VVAPGLPSGEAFDRLIHPTDMPRRHDVRQLPSDIASDIKKSPVDLRRPGF
jgi:hypothetical protein